MLALVDGTLGYDPPFATQRRDKGDFDTFVADAKRDHCCLPIQSRHFSSPLQTSSLVSLGCWFTLWSFLVQIDRLFTIVRVASTLHQANAWTHDCWHTNKGG